ncbi:hypothetical protein LX64_00153 [Chitinophaga skermanii]|uniref:Cro/C1-type helix-turn-helix DNA-binding protein n=1 Tax=Chitinophaga skermanii TaxID=331697 RepID=A0A327R113_9BACT|nr:hypothetical protein [Chitinophaga skermanii]RAJ10549.1 hypothetical protein LX64_00153 [Chitinophaga skermanii]
MAYYNHKWVHEGILLRRLITKRNMTVKDFSLLVGFAYQSAHYYLRKEFIKRSKLQEFLYLLNCDEEEFYSLQDDNYQYTPHHGQRLLSLLSEYGINKTRFAINLKIKRSALYALFQEETFDYNMLTNVCSLLGITPHQFDAFNWMVAEDNEPFARPAKHDYRDKYLHEKEKNISLADAYSILKAQKLEKDEECLLLQAEVAELKRKLKKQ